jgi:hypothetical protein
MIGKPTENRLLIHEDQTITGVNVLLICPPFLLLHIRLE